MISNPLERMSEMERETVAQTLANLKGKTNCLSTDVQPLFTLWDKYRLGNKQRIGCSGCVRYVLSKFINWSNG